MCVVYTFGPQSLFSFAPDNSSSYFRKQNHRLHHNARRQAYFPLLVDTRETISLVRFSNAYRHGWCDVPTPHIWRLVGELVDYYYDIPNSTKYTLTFSSHLIYNRYFAPHPKRKNHIIYCGSGRAMYCFHLIFFYIFAIRFFFSLLVFSFRLQGKVWNEIQPGFIVEQKQNRQKKPRAEHYMSLFFSLFFSVCSSAG